MNPPEFYPMPEPTGDSSSRDAVLLQLIDGQLSLESFAELEQQMATDPELRQRYLELIDIEFGLEQKFGTKPLTEAALQASLAQGSHDPVTVNDQSASKLNSSVSKTTGRRRRELAVWTALAVSLLLVFGWSTGRLFQQSITSVAINDSEIGGVVKPAHSVATVTQAAGAELFNRPAPRLGQAIPRGEEWTLTTGMLELTFNSGAEVIVESPAVLTVVDDEALSVQVGRFSVHAPPGAEGFEIRTPESRVVDRGTRFLLDVMQLGHTEVQVIEGEAELWPQQDHDKQTPQSIPANDDSASQPSSSQPVRLFKGEARSTRGDLFDVVDYDSQHYLYRLPDRVMGYQVETDDDGRATDLLSVDVQRGGDVQTYSFDELIGGDVASYVSGDIINALTPTGYFSSAENSLQAWLALGQHDSSLLTGWINPGGAKDPSEDANLPADQPIAAGMSIQFREPVVNGPGQDVLVFDVHSAIHARQGDGFFVRPGQNTILAVDGKQVHAIHNPPYDLTVLTPELPTLAPFDLYRWDRKDRDRLTLVQRTPSLFRSKLTFWATVVGLDLSDMGVGEGETIRELILQDDLQDEDMIDPVMVVGLPISTNKTISHENRKGK